jgi:hypothetical protein
MARSKDRPGWWWRNVVRATLNRYAGHLPPGPVVDRLERVAVPVGDTRRTLVFCRGTVAETEGSLLTLTRASGRRSTLLVTADTAYGIRRLPTSRADVVPGVAVAAVAEQLDDHRELALRIVVVPAGVGWGLPARP